MDLALLIEEALPQDDSDVPVSGMHIPWLS